jgi:hypothetical protein
MRRHAGLLFASVVAAACTSQPVNISSAPAAPAASRGAASAEPCRSQDLTISLTNSGGGAGTAGGYIAFRNTSTAACTLQGAPTLEAVTAGGEVTRARVSEATGIPFPDVSAPPIVVLLPGDIAFAAYGGSDNPAGALACPPPFHTFRVTPPGGTKAIELAAFNAWLNQDARACAGIAVTYIDSAHDVGQTTDLGSLRP